MEKAKGTGSKELNKSAKMGMAKEKNCKDPNKPKRPASAFFVFMEEFRQQFKAQNPYNKSVAAVGKAGGTKWKSMSDSEKIPYQIKGDQRKRDYEKNLMSYNKKLSVGGNDEEDDSDKSKSEEEEDSTLQKNPCPVSSQATIVPLAPAVDPAAIGGGTMDTSESDIRSSPIGSLATPVRSAKRVQKCWIDESVKMPAVTSPAPTSASLQPQASYLNSFMGDKSSTLKDLENEVEDDWEDLENDEEDKTPFDGGDIIQSDLGPIVHISAEEKRKLRKDWKDTLIIKLLGLSLPYDALVARLKQEWCLKGNFKLMDLPNNFYIARFSNQEDLDHVMLEGPWVIADHYLAIQKWCPEFHAESESISRVAVWVRIPGLVPEYFNSEILRKAATAIGKFLRVDRNTELKESGQFARLAVEVDLDKPLAPTVKIGAHWYKIEYEGPYMICFQCGKYGHRLDNCPDKTVDVTPPEGQHKPVDTNMHPEKRAMHTINQLTGPSFVSTFKFPNNPLREEFSQQFKDQNPNNESVAAVGKGCGAKRKRDPTLFHRI